MTLKIVHLLKHGYQNNGHVHVAVDLACAQAAAGHQVVVVQTAGSFDDLLGNHGVHVVNLGELRGRLGAVTSSLRALRELRRLRPGVVHAHMMSSAVLGYVARRLFGTPLVTTVHNPFDSHSVLMRLGTRVVAVSDAERADLIRRGFRADRLVTVLNGPLGSPRDEAAGTPSLEDLRVPRPSVMTLCGLHPRKAVDDVIHAFAILQPDFPSWHLNVVGDGPQRAELELLTRRLGLDDKVHFYGNRTQTRWLLEQTDIFASGSLADPFSLAVAEARGAGAAVVATGVDGVPEVLEFGRAGLIVPAADPKGMAAALRRLMHDPGELARWRARALDGADHFSLPRVMEEYQAVYQAAARANR